MERARILLQEYKESSNKESVFKNIKDQPCWIYSNEHGAYWGENRSGYHNSKDKAGVYSLEDALDASAHCGKEKGIEYIFLNGEDLLEIDIKEALELIEKELRSAISKFPKPFHSSHEAYAVILEEVDELWDEIKNDKHKDAIKLQREEAVQIGAMAAKFLIQIR